MLSNYIFIYELISFKNLKIVSPATKDHVRYCHYLSSFIHKVFHLLLKKH